MAVPAVKHLDPVIGVDVHMVAIGPDPEVPLPHPHVGFVLDLREYAGAAMGVIGSIVFTFVEDKAVEYLDAHPDVAEQLEHSLDAAADELGKVEAGVMSDPVAAKAVELAGQGMTIAGDGMAMAGESANAMGAGVGMGVSSGRPVFVNGFLRATAGTHTFHIEGLHFPLGESFAPPDSEPMPSNDGESYMGSRTVLANNDPMSFTALPAMSCWAEGLEPPQHNGTHTERTYPSMPSSVMLPIPAGRPVLVGGPPVMNMAAAGMGLFKAFQGSEWARKLADKLHLKPGFLRCNVLRAEPVDATTGEVVVQQRDFTVAGRLPLEWDRYYASHDTHAGAVGMRWQTPADIRLELLPHDGGIGAAAYFPDHATAYDALPAAEGWSARVYDWQHGHALYRLDDRLVLRTREGIEYGFGLPPRWPQMAAMLGGDTRLKLPVERIADLNGNAWVFARNEWGRVARIAEWTRDGATARVIECDTRDAAHDGVSGGVHAGWLSALTLIDAEGRAHPLVGYEHDVERNLRAAVDAMAQPHCFDYADGHRMVSHTSARGVSFYYHHCVDEDGVWRVDRAWGDEGLFDYRFAYDRARMETRITDSRGYTSVLQLNERGLPVAEIDPLGGVTGYRYDAQGRTNARIDPAGRATAWDYDRQGNLLAQTLPDASVIRTEYDANHRPVCVTLPGGRQWRYEWDGRGNMLAQTAPSGAISRYAYDPYGQPVEHTGARGGITKFEYDREGNLSGLTDALGHRTQYRHDARGNLVEAVDALGRPSHYEYDRNANLLRAIEPGGREVHCVYDTDGNLIRYRDAAGHVTEMEYSALGQVRRRVAPDGTVVEYRYDTEEELIGVVNERGELYALERDALARIVGETDYWGQTRRYRYGSGGELLDSTDPLGQTIRYRYDRRGRLVEKQAPNPERVDGTWIDRFAYDRHGDLVLAENPSCRVEFQYDADGRVIEERQGDDFTIASAYDAAGNRTERKTTLVVGGGVVEHTVRYAYDALDAVTSIQIDDAAPAVLERDALGQICAEQLSADLRRELSYETDGQLASQQTLLAGTGVLFASEYAYDANGELIEKRDSRSGAERYQYDPVGRITAHTDPTGRLRRFLHDPAGDLLRTHIRERRTVGAADSTPADTWVRDGEYNGCYYAYDRAGNLIRKQDAAQDLTMHWNAAGLLVETVAVRPAVAVSGGIPTHIRAQYEYDPFGRRTRKVVHAGGGGAASRESSARVSRFFWDGDALAEEHATCDFRDDKVTIVTERITECTAGSAGTHEEQAVGGSASRTRDAYEWIYYPNGFRPIATAYCNLEKLQMPKGPAKQPKSESGILYIYQHNPNGAPVSLHDAGGRVVWDARYSSTGSIECAQHSTVQPLRLQGQYHDAETLFYYNRYRYFDPEIGQFINQDPIGLSGGIHPYKFAANTISWIDPLGLSAWNDFQRALSRVGISVNRSTAAKAYWRLEQSPGRLMRPAGPFSHDKLGNIVADLYKGDQRPPILGTGSSADAVRVEQETGQLVLGKNHTAKCSQYKNALKKIHAPRATASDVQVAQDLLNDIKNALRGN